MKEDIKLISMFNEIDKDIISNNNNNDNKNSKYENKSTKIVSLGNY